MTAPVFKLYDKNKNQIRESEAEVFSRIYSLRDFFNNDFAK